MSTNEEAVTKAPQRRKAKRKSKTSKSTSAQKGVPKDKKPKADTPIVITGGIVITPILMEFSNVVFEKYKDINTKRYHAHADDSAQVRSVSVVSVSGVELVKYDIDEADRPGCKVTISCG